MPDSETATSKRPNAPLLKLVTKNTTIDVEKTGFIRLTESKTFEIDYDFIGLRAEDVVLRAVLEDKTIAHIVSFENER